MPNAYQNVRKHMHKWRTAVRMKTLIDTAEKTYLLLSPYSPTHQIKTIQYDQCAQTLLHAAASFLSLSSLTMKVTRLGPL